MHSLTLNFFKLIQNNVFLDLIEFFDTYNFVMLVLVLVLSICSF